jgi:hypothetical protein
MNVRHVTIAAGSMLAILSSSAGFAQEAEPDTWITLPQPTSRAVVKAELARHLAEMRAAGLRPAQEAEPDTWILAASTKTRAQVRAELFAAQRSGEFERIHAEAARFDDIVPPVVLAARSR